MRRLTGATTVAGVAGNPVEHSLSPLIHNAWLEAAGLDGIYVAFAPAADRFDQFVEGMRGGTVRGVNVTIPFKEVALSMADEVSVRAQGAAAANVLVFERDGTILADNTDGLGLLAAFKAQAPGFDITAGPVAILGAGGAARGAASALLTAGAPEVRIVNRTLAKAEAVAGALHGAVKACPISACGEAFAGVVAVVNATSTSLTGDDLDVPLDATPETAVVMDMVYKPLVTPFLQRAQQLGRRTVDGLEMLIRQAAPSFEAFYGRSPPADVDVRALALAELGEGQGG